MEEGSKSVIDNPEHPYTKGLINALPGGIQAGSRLAQIPGMMPTLTDIPMAGASAAGCAFEWTGFGLKNDRNRILDGKTHSAGLPYVGRKPIMKCRSYEYGHNESPSDQ